MNLCSLLDLPALIVPDSTALMATEASDGEESEVTYEQLRARTAQIAGFLRDRNLGRGDRIGIMATNCLDAIATVFAAASQGAIAVPMNFRAGAEELEHLISDSGVSLLVAQQRYVAMINETGTAAEVVVIGERDPFVASEPEFNIVDVDDDQLAVLLYTSGTTSKAKGVRITHAALTTYVMTSNDAATGEDRGRSLLAAPLYHVAGLTALLHALYSGRITVLIPQFEADLWLDAVARYRVTHAFLVPTMLARLLASERLDTTELSSLESLTYGAAPMPAAVIERAIERFPASVEFAGAYGQTETTSTVAVLGPDDHRLDGPEGERNRQRLRSVGKVVDDVEVRIVDADGGDLAPDEIGEVWLRTYRATSGYWGAEEKTRVSIDADGWVHTGDLGRLDAEGYLFLEGRSGDMIIRGGENVSPEEVEGVLHEHPAISDAAIKGVPDEEWGERLVAYVVLHDAVPDDPEGVISSLSEHCRERLAPFKRPSEFRVVDELPRTSTGKLIRRQLGD